MRFTPSLSIALSATISSVTSKSVNPSAQYAKRAEDLGNWFTSGIAQILPNHTGWEDSFDIYFSKNLTASFNQPTYDFDGMKGYYTTAGEAMSTYFDSFSVNFTSVVAVPNTDNDGGIVTVTGIEGGIQKDGTTNTGADAAFAVIAIEDGVRKIVEMRESTEFKFS